MLSTARLPFVCSFAVIAVLGALADTADATVIQSNLLAYYDFEGDVSDRGPNGAPDATLTSGAILTAAGGGYDGVGQALDVSGGSSAAGVVSAGTHFDSAFSSDTMAVSFWQKNPGNGNGFDNTSTFRITTTAGDGRGFQAHVPWGDGTIYFDHAGSASGNARLTTSGSGITANAWDHFVFQKSGGTKEIWLNGTMLNSTASASPLTSFTGELMIGTDGTGNDFTGQVDDFAVWNEVLDETQIQALASGTSAGELVGIPEPSTLVLSALSLFAVIGLRRPRKQ